MDRSCQQSTGREGILDEKWRDHDSRIASSAPTRRARAVGVATLFVYPELGACARAKPGDAVAALRSPLD